MNIPPQESSEDSTLLHLKILLPSRIFADKKDVTRLVAKTPAGSFGLLPYRPDFQAALVPGILTYETEDEGLINIAIGLGIMIKSGMDVLVCVRNAATCANLDESAIVPDGGHSVLAMMESGLTPSFVEFPAETGRQDRRIQPS